MKISESNTRRFYNPTYDEMEAGIMMLQELAVIAKCHPTEKFLFLVWFGGHGEMSNGSATTQVVTNDPDPAKRHFDFE